VTGVGLVGRILGMDWAREIAESKFPGFYCLLAARSRARHQSRGVEIDTTYSKVLATYIEIHGT
jgi:hypothetical protein